jgi:hypothetical protein
VEGTLCAEGLFVFPLAKMTVALFLGTDATQNTDSLTEPNVLLHEAWIQ